MKNPKVALYLLIGGILSFVVGLWLLMKKRVDTIDNNGAEHMAKMRAAKAAKKVESEIGETQQELILDSKINLNTDESVIAENQL